MGADAPVVEFAAVDFGPLPDSTRLLERPALSVDRGTETEAVPGELAGDEAGGPLGSTPPEALELCGDAGAGVQLDDTTAATMMQTSDHGAGLDLNSHTRQYYPGASTGAITVKSRFDLAGNLQSTPRCARVTRRMLTGTLGLLLGRC